MQKAKSKKQKFEFPNIFRVISEPKMIFVEALCIIALILVGATGSETYKRFQEKQRIGVERQNLIAKMHYWEAVVEKYKGYRDGYFQLVVISYQLGKKDEAKKYLEKVFELDPNFEEGRRLELILK